MSRIAGDRRYLRQRGDGNRQPGAQAVKRTGSSCREWLRTVRELVHQAFRLRPPFPAARGHNRGVGLNRSLPVHLPRMADNRQLLRVEVDNLRPGLGLVGQSVLGNSRHNLRRPPGRSGRVRRDGCRGDIPAGLDARGEAIKKEQQSRKANASAPWTLSLLRVHTPLVVHRTDCAGDGYFFSGKTSSRLRQSSALTPEQALAHSG